MNPRKFIDFLMSRTGVLLLTLALLPAAVLLSRGCRQGEGRMGSSRFSQRTNGYGTERFVGEESRSKSANTKTSSAVTNVATNEPLPSLRIYSATNSTLTPSDPEFLPYGTLVPCKLIITVDSSNIQTPMIGLVIDNVSQNSRVVIPSNTLVHGRATGHVRNRIAGEGSWTLVWQSGQELVVPAIVLNHAPKPGGGAGPTDGSAGVEGEIIRSQQHAEMKLFLSTLLSGMASAAQDRQSTVLGSQIVPQAQNYTLAGAGVVLDRYSQLLLQQIERELYFVRVSAGKSFYLYLTSSLLRSKARAAGTITEPDAEAAMERTSKTSTP